MVIVMSMSMLDTGRVIMVPLYHTSLASCKLCCVSISHSGKTRIYAVNSYPADRDYCRFHSVLLVDQITVIGNEMCVQISRFANICAQIIQIGVVFNRLKLWVAVARHIFKWVKI